MRAIRLGTVLAAASLLPFHVSCGDDGGGGAGSDIDADSDTDTDTDTDADSDTPDPDPAAPFAAVELFTSES